MTISEKKQYQLRSPEFETRFKIELNTKIRSIDVLSNRSFYARDELETDSGIGDSKTVAYVAKKRVYERQHFHVDVLCRTGIYPKIKTSERGIFLKTEK